MTSQGKRLSKADKIGQLWGLAPKIHLLTEPSLGRQPMWMRLARARIFLLRRTGQVPVRPHVPQYIQPKPGRTLFQNII